MSADNLKATALAILGWRNHPAQNMAKDVARAYLAERRKIDRIEALIMNPFHDNIRIDVKLIRAELQDRE